MSLHRVPSLCFDIKEPEPGSGSLFAEDLRGPLSNDDLAFLQAWVDFAPDVNQQYSDTPELDSNEDLEVGDETLVLATRKFALAQRLALRADGPHSQDFRTFGNTVFSPRASQKELSTQKLNFNPLFGASFQGGLAANADEDEDEADGALARALGKEQLSYEYEALMRADMRDLEAFGFIHWSPDDLVEAELARGFSRSEPAAPATPSLSSLDATRSGAAASAWDGDGDGDGDGKSSISGGICGVWEPRRSYLSRFALGLGEGIGAEASAPVGVAADACMSPGTPTAACAAPRCFRDPTTMTTNVNVKTSIQASLAAGGAAVTDDVMEAAAQENSVAVRNGDGGDDEANWRRFVEGLGDLPYEYEALMRADMGDLEAFGLVDWSPDDLVEAQLARGLGLTFPSAATDPWVVAQADGSAGAHGRPPPASLAAPAECDDSVRSSSVGCDGGAGGSGGGDAAVAAGFDCATSLIGGKRPSLALPAACLSAPTAFSASPLSPPTPAAGCAPPSCFRAPAAAKVPETEGTQPPMAGYAAAAAAAVAMAAADRAPSNSAGAGGGDDDKGDDSDDDEANWRRFVEGLGELSYEYEALMRADMGDLEGFGLVDWSPDDLVEAELARGFGEEPADEAAAAAEEEVGVEDVCVEEAPVAVPFDGAVSGATWPPLGRSRGSSGRSAPAAAAAGIWCCFGGAPLVSV